MIVNNEDCFKFEMQKLEIIKEILMITDTLPIVWSCKPKMMLRFEHIIQCHHNMCLSSLLRGGLHYGPRAMTMKF